MIIIWVFWDLRSEKLIMILSWTRGDRPCWELFDFMIVRWDRAHRHVEIVRVGIWTSRVPHGSWTLNVISRSIMCIRLREYLVFWGISYYGVIVHCIPWHLSFLMLMFFIGGWKVFGNCLTLFDELDLLCCWYCECLLEEVVIDEF